MTSESPLYSDLCSYGNLLLAFQKARKGKTQKPYVQDFEKNLPNNLFKLQWELVTFTYAPGPSTTFIVRDPKSRRITASDFRDRVVHHAIINIVGPKLERSFVQDSYANRKGKGTHAAIRRFETFSRKVTGNGKLLRRERERELSLFWPDNRIRAQMRYRPLL